jgi:hypothetical protein
MKITFWELKHSPYVARRNVNVFIEDVAPEDILGLAIMRNDGFVKYQSFDEYLNSFCSYCNGGKCFRHFTALNFVNSIFMVPDAERELEFSISRVTDKDTVWLRSLNVSFTRWRAQGNDDEIIITRPSGRTFKYRNHGEVSTYRFILHWLAKGVWDIIPYHL